VCVRARPLRPRFEPSRAAGTARFVGSGESRHAHPRTIQAVTLACQAGWPGCVRERCLRADGHPAPLRWEGTTKEHLVSVLIGLFVAGVAVAGWNLTYFLLRHSSSAKQEGQHTRWLVRFLLLGPFAGAWHSSQQRVARTDKPTVRPLHAAARGFLAPWTAFALMVPLPTIALVELAVSGGLEAAEILMWSPVIYILGIIPFVVLPPLVVAWLVMYSTRTETTPPPPQPAPPAPETVPAPPE
jgi:hypothetical protein